MKLSVWKINSELLPSYSEWDDSGHFGKSRLFCLYRYAFFSIITIFSICCSNYLLTSADSKIVFIGNKKRGQHGIMNRGALSGNRFLALSVT